MADQDQRSEQEIAEEEERRKRGLPTLDEEVAKRWDPDRLKSTVARDAGRGERLDLSQRNELEKLHPGRDFSDVRVYRGALAEEITNRHKADAVTIANTGMIMLRDTPRASPGTTSGQALLAHEATHVAQAQRGFQFADSHGQGEDSEHEKEARGVEHRAEEGDHGDHHAPSGGPGGNDIEKDRARRQAITDRVMELLDKDRDLFAFRSGRNWK